MHASNSDPQALPPAGILELANEIDLAGGARFNAYGRACVAQYCLVDSAARTVRQFEHRGGAPVPAAVLTAGDLLTSSLFPDVSMPVSRLFR